MITKRTIEEFNTDGLNIPWYTIEHPPYSPDLAPSDFYLFKHLQNYLKDSTFRNKRETVEEVKSFLDSRTCDFLKQGTYNLPNRWKEVINRKGNYLDD